MTALRRLRDLLLTAGCSAGASVAALLLIGKFKFEALFEAALGGRTLLWTALAAAIAVGCAAGFVLGKPPCAGGDGGV